jgi:hypothetical protein
MFNFTSLLTITFITLKLTGFIGWSWFLVLSPVIVWLLFVAVLMVGAVLLGRYDAKNKYRI